MILRLFDWVFFPQKEQKYFEQWKPEVAIGQCMSASMLTLRCASLCALQCVLHVLVTFLCVVLHFLWERSEWQRTRVGNVLCVSEATQGGFGMVWLKLTCGFHWAGLAGHPIPMVTSCPTNPHYQSGCSFLRSRRCCRSCHQSHLWRTRSEVR